MTPENEATTLFEENDAIGEGTVVSKDNDNELINIDMKKNEVEVIVDEKKVENGGVVKEEGLELKRQCSFFRQASEYNEAGGPKPIERRVLRTVSQGAIVIHKTILDALEYNVSKYPKTIFTRWVNENCQVTQQLGYQQLWENSMAVAKLLKQKGVKRGDRVMITFPFGLEFLSGLMGCIMYGAIACSVYPPDPTNKKRAKFSFQQFNNQVKDAGAKFSLTTASFKRIIQAFALTSPKNKTHVKWLATDKLKPISSDNKNEVPIVMPNPDDIAFIQYSSGSTGTPKGVMISHRALLHNMHSIQSVSVDKEEAKTMGVCWMPQYHDYGLINFFLLPVASRYMPTVCCSPLHFIKNPLLWADMLEKFEGTQTGGPNFAYGLLCKRLKAAKRTLRIPSLIRASIAAEPINPSTLDAMVQAGFSKSTINPCYGLAECCAYVTCCIGNEVTIDPTEGVVSSGLVDRNEAYDKEIIIVKDDKVAEPGHVGEIHISGPDLASGYWNKADLTKQTFQSFQDPNTGKYFTNTGDLGKIDEKGLLYVCGRAKELIIVNGRNVYPTDLERTLESEYPDIVRPGSTVAFQWNNDDVGIVLEIRKTADKQQVTQQLTSKSIKTLLNAAHNVKLGAIFVLPQGTVPKTTSGKLRRVETRDKSHRYKQQEGCSGSGCWTNAVWTWIENVESGSASDTSSSPLYQDEKLVDKNHLDSDNMHCMTKEGQFETLVKQTLGGDVDMNADWQENGLTSLQHAELRGHVEERFQVTLPLEFESMFATPSTLMSSVLESSSSLFATRLPRLESNIKYVDTAKSLSMTSLMILQALGVFFQFLVFSLSLMPPFYVGKALLDFRSTFEVGNSGRFVTWSWFPFVIPTFFASFTLAVLILKWIVIGKYRSTIVELPSLTFVRWWLVDRVLELWEAWVGQFLLETKVLWLFYRLMGAKISWSTDVDAFIREFDLVSIGEESKISHYVRCRKFHVWRDDGPASMAFRPIVIGKNCTIEGMVSPGCVVGDGSKVCSHSALQEGAQVPEKTVARGSPAFDAGKNSGEEQRGDGGFVHCCRLVWLFVELYLFFVAALLGQVILEDQLPPKFRYSPLLYWFLLLFMIGVFGICVSIILKWTLIGRRRPGNKQNGKLWDVIHWCVDYHFVVAGLSLYTIWTTSIMWNVILYLHGMDIDRGTFLNSPLDIVPSKLDLIKIRRSFLSTMKFNFSSSSDRVGGVEILDSSIGFSVEIQPGVKIHRSVISPRSIIEESIYDKRTSHSSDTKRSWADALVLEFMQLCCSVLLLVSLIPSYEVFTSTVSTNVNPGLAILGLCAAIIVQSAVWLLMQRVIQAMTECRGNNLQFHQYAIYLNQEYLTQRYSMISVLYGSPFFTWMLQYFWGSRLEGQGRVWYFGKRIYDHGLLTFADRTIVDHSHLSGHYVVYDQLSLVETSIQGVVHGECFLAGGARLVGLESGPHHVFLDAAAVEKDTVTAAASNHEGGGDSCDSDVAEKV